MTGREDIKGSKSNVAMIAKPPQASYPYGNFSVTLYLEYRNYERTIGQAFAITNNEIPYLSEHLPFCPTRDSCFRCSHI